MTAIWQMIKGMIVMLSLPVGILIIVPMALLTVFTLYLWAVLSGFGQLCRSLLPGNHLPSGQGQRNPVQLQQFPLPAEDHLIPKL